MIVINRKNNITRRTKENNGEPGRGPLPAGPYLLQYQTAGGNPFRKKLAVK